MTVPTQSIDPVAASEQAARLLGSELTAWPILTATAGLVAFHIGLFTLVGRERKSPYAINAIFPVFLLCLTVAALASATSIVPQPYARWGLVFSVALLVVAFVWSAVVLTRIAVRFIYFVEAVRITDLWPFRRIALWRKRRSVGPTYSHDPNPIPDELGARILEILQGSQDGTLEVREHLDPLSVAVATEHQGQASMLFAELAEAFLGAGFTVQYLTAARHPIEFLVYLDLHLRRSGADLRRYRDSIVVIDAYSSHFAFLDSIYPKKDRDVEAMGVTLIPSKATYAGMHSASSKAFKRIKASVGDKKDRDPTLVIYEDCHALSDLESVEQYRIFVRHVMPSERMWGGMFTVFSESVQPEADWRILQSYASMRLDYRTAASHAKRSERVSSGEPASGGR